MKCVICGKEVTRANISTSGLPYLCFRCEDEVVVEPLYEALWIYGDGIDDLVEVEQK